MVAKEILRKRNSIFHAAMIEKTKAPLTIKLKKCIGQQAHLCNLPIGPI
jgi:hypothetical protein